MTITVAITPEVQAELARQAAAHGRAMEAYAASLLEGAVRLPACADRLSQRFEGLRAIHPANVARP
jgi:plasmid stability protein